jgi:hypothetical protein
MRLKRESLKVRGSRGEVQVSCSQHMALFLRLGCVRQCLITDIMYS